MVYLLYRILLILELHKQGRIFFWIFCINRNVQFVLKHLLKNIYVTWMWVVLRKHIPYSVSQNTNIVALLGSPHHENYHHDIFILYVINIRIHNHEKYVEFSRLITMCALQLGNLTGYCWIIRVLTSLLRLIREPNTFGIYLRHLDSSRSS